MKVFVTGAEGYIGYVLTQRLAANGYEVLGLDTGFYRDGWLYSRPSMFATQEKCLLKDLRKIAPEDLAGCDAVVHLAELSNDPLGENSPDVTFEINHRGSVNLANIARQAGISRFVYTSSCSVYGVSDADMVTEDSATNPQTAYARCKVLVENDLRQMAGPDFCPVFLRNATAYGPSPRMRFDIVLNNLAGLAWTTGKIAMTSDGSPWRPVVHVDDICTAIICALEADAHAVRGEIFNVGRTDDNFQIRELAELVNAAVPGCHLSFGDPVGDNRSYRVSFEKIANKLPGFKCKWTVSDGAEQLIEIFRQIHMGEGTFNSRPFTRLRQIKYLVDTGQLDPNFYWVV